MAFFCFKTKKGDGLKIFISYLVPFLLVILFYITFYGIFNFVAESRKIAISEVGIFSVSLINVGRFDHLALFCLALSSIIAVSLPVMMSCYCLITVFGNKKRLTMAIILTFLLFITCILFSSKYANCFNFISKYIMPLFVLCGYIFPLFALRGNKNELQTS